MTQEELNYIKDAFSQIIDDIAGNPDWHEAARAVASDLGTLERELGEKVVSLPADLDEAARKAALMPELVGVDEEHLDEYPYSPIAEQKFKDGAEWAREQMMKGAVEAMVGRNFTGVQEVSFTVYPDKYKEGDKVRIIIIMEDGK